MSKRVLFEGPARTWNFSIEETLVKGWYPSEDLIILNSNVGAKHFCINAIQFPSDHK